MAEKLVTIVNSNGRKGRVSPKYPPLLAGKLRLAPSERAGQVPDDDPSIEVDPHHVPELPPANASTDVWQSYAASDVGRAFAVDNDLDPDEVPTRSRDDLVALFTSKE